MRFELLGGRHTDDDGNDLRFRQGRMVFVNSDKPLDKMFKNKFRRADTETDYPPDHRNTANVSGGRVTDDPKALKREKRLKIQKKMKGTGGKMAIEDKDTFTDLTQSRRPRRIARAVEADQRRSVDREAEEGYDEDEEGNLLDDEGRLSSEEEEEITTDHNETDEETNEFAPQKMKAKKNKAKEPEPEPEEDEEASAEEEPEEIDEEPPAEEEEEAPPPAPKKKMKMKKKKK